MSIKSNYIYIKNWIESKFLKKESIEDYYTKTEVDDIINATSEQLDSINDYLSKSDYLSDEDVIASSLVDLDTRIKTLSENINNALSLKIGQEEEKVIAIALNDLNEKTSSMITSDSPSFTGIPTAPTAASGTSTTQIATTEFVTNAVPILGITLNGSSGSLNNHVANLTLTKSSTGTGNIVTDVSIEGNVITVNKSNLPFKANSGTTRPTLTSSDVGYVFLDLSLGTSGKPIWWTGSNWIDATGATV